MIAEKMSPDGLMSLMNEYLSERPTFIEGHGGYVDKYIGDSIVAVFGAPADDHDHAANAAGAALDCCKRLANSSRFRHLPGCKLASRSESTPATRWFGNFGSHRRSIIRHERRR